MYKRAFAAGVAIFFLFSFAVAQKGEVTVSLNEPFFEAFLDSIFQNFDPPEFSIAQNIRDGRDTGTQNRPIKAFQTAFRSSAQNSAPRQPSGNKPVCIESIKLLREMNGVRTAVRLREGKIQVPIAFSGSYAPPFIGCVEFAGWAETNIDLEFDQAGQRLVGRARVLKVNLNGAGGIGGTAIAKLIQSSIDKKLNPMEIMRLDKLSFVVPVQNAGSIRMKAVSVRPEIANGTLNIVISYQFVKA